jgi:hypothetical protein
MVFGTEFRFVEDGNIDQKTRKSIRRHVMKGKNVGKIRPKALPKTINRIASSSIPAVVGDEFSAFVFPSRVEPYMNNLIRQFLFVTHRQAYPLEICLDLTHPTHGKAMWFQLMLKEDACKLCLLEQIDG